MKRLRPLALFLIILLSFESLASSGNPVHGSPNRTDTFNKAKVYFEWMPHTYWRNKTGSPVFRMTSVDYKTGLFTVENVELDFIDTSKEYDFRSVQGMNTKSPHISYTVFKSGNTEKILSYNSRNNSIAFLAERSVPGESIDGVYPDAGMYIVKRSSNKKYLIYSLMTNKLIHTTKQWPIENRNSFMITGLNGNYFDPAPGLGAIYFDPPIYYDTKTSSYKTNPGEYPYEIKADGTVVKLHSYRTNRSEDYVYKKKLSDSTIFKESKAGDNVKHELIINGKIHTLHEANFKRSSYSNAVAQISPKGETLVLYLSFFENKRRVMDKVEYRIYDTKTGALIRNIHVNSVGLPSSIDYKINWIANTDHIIQSGMLNPATYRTIDPEVKTPWNYGNVVDAYFSPYYTFSLRGYLSTNDPIPVSFKGNYMQYSGQGTFRISNLTTYSPIGELMTLLGGSMLEENKKITVSYQEKSYVLDSNKQIHWKGQTFYPLREILTALGLKLVDKKSELASDNWREFEIIE